MRYRSRMAAAIVTVAMALPLVACTGSRPATGAPVDGFDAASTRVVAPSGRRGGTLRLQTSQDADSWDPGVSYDTAVWDMQRFYVRALLAYAAAPGAAGLRVVPDLAAALPVVSADRLTYTFTLRRGVRFDDGTAVTSRDVKYGIERTFATDVLAGGPGYLQQQLDQGQNYPGPYRDTDPGKLGLRSVGTPDDRTIVFHLAAPFADFPYLLTMGGSAPVPAARDTGDRYALRPVSSGPYEFSSYAPGKSLVLVRNPYWDASTDPLRKALPDKVTVEVNPNADDIDNRLLAGAIDVDLSQAGVQAPMQTRVAGDAALQAHFDDPASGLLRYIAMPVTVPPFDNVHCRRAVLYAADHHTLMIAEGGALGGDAATQLLPPGVPGADPGFDPYGTRQGAPQLGKAREELRACGKPDGFATKMLVRDNVPKDVRVAEALQQALAAVGISAEVVQYDGRQFAATAGAPDLVHRNGYGLINAGWAADWQSGYAFLQPIADGRAIGPQGNTDLAELNNPDVNALLDRAAAGADVYRDLDRELMDQAVYLPIAFPKVLNYRAPRLTNVYVHRAFGMVDFQALGVNDGR